jgi:hypothetical protein
VIGQKSLHRIEQATGVRRETAGDYLRSAGIGLRAPGGWGRQAPAKPANEVITDSGCPESGVNSKPAIEVITGFLLGKPPSGGVGKGSASATEAYREWVVRELERGRNAMGIWQDLVDRHGFQNSYQSVQRFVRGLRAAMSREARVIIETRPGEEAQALLRAAPRRAWSTAPGTYRDITKTQTAYSSRPEQTFR